MILFSNVLKRLSPATSAILLAGLLLGSVAGCKLLRSKAAERVPLKLMVFVGQFPEEAAQNVAQGLRVLLDPFELRPKPEPEDKNFEIRQILFLPDEVVVRRLDCPPGSELKISAKDWQKGFMMKMAQALGNPSPTRYQESWRLNGLSRITGETLKKMGSFGKEPSSPPIDTSAPQSEFTYFYLINPQGKPRPDLIPASFSAEKVSAVSSPAAFWQQVYARMSKVPPSQPLTLLVHYDPFAKCPTPDEILAAYRAGEYSKVRGLLDLGRTWGQEEKFQELIKNTPVVKASLRYLMNRRSYQTEISESLVLTQDTPYSLEFDLAQGPAYLYVTQIDKAGKVFVLYPDKDAGESQEIKNSATIRCPRSPDASGRSQWFRLDEFKGPEKIYILAAAVENQRLSQWINAGQLEELKNYLQGLEQNPPAIPGVYFQVQVFTHR